MRLDQQKALEAKNAVLEQLLAPDACVDRAYTSHFDDAARIEVVETNRTIRGRVRDGSLSAGLLRTFRRLVAKRCGARSPEEAARLGQLIACLDEQARIASEQENVARKLVGVPERAAVPALTREDA